MEKQYAQWSGALTVTVITTVLVILDVTDRSVHRFWSRHSFTSSVLSGLLVLLLTVLIVDRVIALRELRNRSRAIAAQAAFIVAQAARAADAVARTAPAGDDGESDDRQEALDELRTYAQMLFTSAPVLIDAAVTRTFLETAQRVAADVVRVLRQPEDEHAEHRKKRLDDAVGQLRAAAAPLIQPLNREQREAVASDDGDSDGA